jgi:23S rRNA (cytosine1962-C5)-methyltransferase
VWPALEAALVRRRTLLRTLHAEGTDCYRLLHGIAEGAPGIAVDRYGPVVLVQTWREPIAVAGIAEQIRAQLDAPLTVVWNHRVRPIDFERWHRPEIPPHPVGLELGVRYDVRPRHRGHDPLLFLDLRALRRRVLAEAAGRSVLNLFAYTCGLGVCAAKAGASEVVNVDFAGSALAVGRRNLALNGLDGAGFHTLRMDALAAVRMLAGRSPGRRPPPQRLEPRTFDLVLLTRRPGPPEPSARSTWSATTRRCSSRRCSPPAREGSWPRPTTWRRSTGIGGSRGWTDVRARPAGRSRGSRPSTPRTTSPAPTAPSR